MEFRDHFVQIAARLCFYGLCGFFCEIVFTASRYFLDSKYSYGWTLHGSTSLWSFPIYAISIFILERMSVYLRPKVWLPVRVVIYVAWTYLWEFSTGYVLTLLGACPWNYDGYTNYHIMGLVTFDYAPLWMVAVVLCEKIVIHMALSLYYIPEKSEKIE